MSKTWNGAILPKRTPNMYANKVENGITSRQIELLESLGCTVTEEMKSTLTYTGVNVLIKKYRILKNNQLMNERAGEANGNK